MGDGWALLLALQVGQSRINRLQQAIHLAHFGRQFRQVVAQYGLIPILGHQPAIDFPQPLMQIFVLPDGQPVELVLLLND